MSANERIELDLGCARWLRVAPWVMAALVLAAILTARSTVVLTMVLLVALCALHAWVLRLMRANAVWQRLTLDATGNAVLFNADGGVPAQLGEPAWISRWLCVVPLRTPAGRHLLHCVICRSRNHPDHYRRLRVRLRLCGDARRAPSALP